MTLEAIAILADAALIHLAEAIAVIDMANARMRDNLDTGEMEEIDYAAGERAYEERVNRARGLLEAIKVITETEKL